MMKIVLIKPNILVRKEFVLRSRMCPPIGLAYIAAALRQDGHDVVIIDTVAEGPGESQEYCETHNAYGITDADMMKRFETIKPDIVGIGGFTNQFGVVRDLVDVVKRYNADIPVVLGGVNATALPKFVLEKTKADYVLLGEAEKSICALLKASASGSADEIDAMDGIGYRRNGNIVIKEKKLFSEDIDAIAWPARDLLDHEKYIADGVAMPVITSRSCPGRCRFCFVHQMTGYKWRGRDPYDVVDEIEDFVSQWGYKTVSIFDDAANVKPDRLVTICKEVVKRKLAIRLTFPSSLILKYVTKELLFWMKQAGAIGLALPIEHSDEYMRNTVIGKKLDLSYVDKVLDWCAEYRLLTLGNFVIGMPGETPETLEDLKEYTKKIAKRMDMFSVYVATPFPGTSFYDECIDKGYLKDPEKNDFLDFDTYTAHIETEKLPVQQLLEYKQLLQDTFIEAKGKDFPEPYIRKIFRKPDQKGLEFLENEYFKKKSLA